MADKEDDNSTENGSSNGDYLSSISSGNAVDPTSVIAAREKSLITHAMDTLTKHVNEAGDESSESDNDQDGAFMDFDGPLVEAPLVPFKLSMPTPLPSHLNIHFICETASRLLFLSIHWVRSIPTFKQLK